jgi:acyl-CoA thioesterase-1
MLSHPTSVVTKYSLIISLVTLIGVLHPIESTRAQTPSPKSPAATHTAPQAPSVTAVKKILCLGDSLTDGYGVAREAAWPALLESALKTAGYPKINVVNAGLSGATSASGLSRLQWQLKSPEKPHILILALGSNDGLRGIDLKSTKANLESVIKLAIQNHIKVILVGMQMPANYGSTYTDEFARIFTDLAKTYQTGLIPFLLEGVAMDKKLNQNDGIHPNELGYKRVVLNVIPQVLSTLESQKPI